MMVKNRKPRLDGGGLNWTDVFCWVVFGPMVLLVGLTVVLMLNPDYTKCREQLGTFQLIGWKCDGVFEDDPVPTGKTYIPGEKGAPGPAGLRGRD
jgi:hypothetical protein